MLESTEVYFDIYGKARLIGVGGNILENAFRHQVYRSAVEIGCSGGDRVFDDRYARWLYNSRKRRIMEDVR